MKRWRTAVACAASISLPLAGCEPAMRNPHDHGGAMVQEIRPRWRPVEHRSPDAAVYVLWRWEPLPPTVAAGPGEELLRAATTRATQVRVSAKVPKRTRWERAIEVDQVYVRRGQDVGFRRRPDGQLIAVAGPTTRPLPAGHYCWHMLPGNPTAESDRRAQQAEQVLLVGTVVLAVAGLVAAILAIDHNDRHAHLLDGVGDILNGTGDGN